MSTDYKELTAWKRAMDLVREVYRCTRAFPREEVFGLTSQMRRAAVSVPSNIAEGKGRYSRKELVQFLYKARGSLMDWKRKSVSRAISASLMTATVALSQPQPSKRQGS